MNFWDFLLGALFGAATVMFVISKTSEFVSADFMFWRTNVQLAFSVLLIARVWPKFWQQVKTNAR